MGRLKKAKYMKNTEKTGTVPSTQINVSVCKSDYIQPFVAI